MSEIAKKNKTRTKQFAKDCLKLLATIDAKSKLFLHIEGQLIRCSTSVAANYRAACLAQSTPTFIAKLSIVIEEVNDSAFWLELLQEETLNSDKVSELINEATELTSMFIAARKKLKNRNK